MKALDPTEAQYRAVDFIFKLVVIVTAVFAVSVPVVIVIYDFLDVAPPLLTSEFLEKFTVLDLPEREGEKLEFNSATLLALLGTFGGALLAQAYRIIRRKDYKTREISKQFQRFSDVYATHIVTSLKKMDEFRSELKSSDARDNTEIYNKLTDLNGQFLSAVATKIAWMARVYTGHACHVSIKVYAPHSNGIRTFARDSITADPRERVDELHGDTIRRYDTNYVFKEIIENSSCHYFISNNLHRDKRYFNRSNAQWAQFYNKCMVVPIANSVEPEKASEILGFICIDSMKGTFKNDYFLSIVVIISRFVSVQFVSVLSTIELRRQRARTSVNNE